MCHVVLTAFAAIVAWWLGISRSRSPSHLIRHLPIPTGAFGFIAQSLHSASLRFRFDSCKQSLSHNVSVPYTQVQTIDPGSTASFHLTPPCNALPAPDRIRIQEARWLLQPGRYGSLQRSNFPHKGHSHENGRERSDRRSKSRQHNLTGSCEAYYEHQCPTSQPARVGTYRQCVLHNNMAPRYRRDAACCVSYASS